MNNKEVTKRVLIFCAVTMLLATTMYAQQFKVNTLKNRGGSSRQNVLANNKYSAYLFTYFAGDDESIRFAISNDGYNYRALNNNMPVISSANISSTGGVRDPHILRAADGKTFYMVATDLHTEKNGWGPNHAMVLLRSEDLVNWSSHIVNIAEKFPELSAVSKVWAPQTIYDTQKGKYMIYWSMSFGDGPIKLFYAYANKDFTGLETSPQQLFFSPDSSTCLDGDIIFNNGKYHLFFKATGKQPGIKKAVSDKLTEGYVILDKRLEQTDRDVEGSGIFKLNNSDTWILMYDLYSSGKYQFTKSKDLKNFTLIDNEVSMNFHPRHGTIISITFQEAETLFSKWMTTDDVVLSVRSKARTVLSHEGFLGCPAILNFEKAKARFIKLDIKKNAGTQLQISELGLFRPL